MTTKLVLWLAAGLATSLLACRAFARDPGLILVYPSHATPQRVLLTGRFIEDEGFKAPHKSSSRWRNLRQAVKRLESDEIRGALIELRVGKHRFEARTDNDGVFRVEADLTESLLPVGAVTVYATALEDKGHHAPPAKGTVFVLPASGVAVISDVDDTVVQSHISSKRKMVKTALLHNAAQLVPVKGMAEAYRAAEAAGATIFYLSGSPQNFVVRIADFLKLRGYPAGPLLLKNFGTDPTFDNQTYKKGRLEAVLAAHPKTRFVLVGDSGEHDPEAYAALRAAHPTQVAGVFIRLVPGANNAIERFPEMHTAPDLSSHQTLITELLTQK